MARRSVQDHHRTPHRSFLRLERQRTTEQTPTDVPASIGSPLCTPPPPTLAASQHDLRLTPGAAFRRCHNALGQGPSKPQTGRHNCGATT